MHRLLFIVLLAAAAMAAPVSLVGDKDCFGLGGPCPDGTGWQSGLGGVFFTNYQGVGDPAFTDKWDSEIAPTYIHSYALPAGALSASLEVKIAGVADSRGPWDVFFNGTNIGQIPTNNGPIAFEEVIAYSWAVPVGLLTGNDTVRLAINFPSVTDGYAIDYSELSIVSEDGSIPEPATFALLGAGLAALALIRRYRR